MKPRAGFPPTVGLILLSLLWAFGWLIPDLLSDSGANPVSLPVGQAILFTGFAVIAAFIAVAQRCEFPRRRGMWAWCAIGVGLFVLPASAAAFARSWISDFDEVAIFCLIPTFTVILEPYLNDTHPLTGKSALTSSLLALAGILCLFPLEIPGSFSAGAALFVCLLAAVGIAITNCVAVRLASTRRGKSILPMAAQAGAAAAICFALIAAFTRGATWDSRALPIYLLRLGLVDIPSLFLLFWLMSRLTASRMAARFLLAPLFASMTSLAFEQKLPSLRASVGLLLLAGGAGSLVFAPVEAESDQLTIL